MNSENMNTSTQAESYLKIQARLLVYTTIFWLVVNLLSRERYHLARLKSLGLDLIQLVVTKTGLVQTVKRTKDQVKLELLRFSFISSAQHLLHNLNYAFYKAGEMLTLKNVPNANLATLVVAKIGELIRLVKSVNRSIASIVHTFSFNIANILKWPGKIRSALMACSQQIRQFWLQIEQIIQIVKLPLEILSLIFSFIKGVGTFMRRIEAPRISRFR